MEINVLDVKSRCATFEIASESCYYAVSPVQATLNGKALAEYTTNVFTLFSLTPGTDYSLELRGESGEARIEFRTGEETACLDVTAFGAVADGQADCTAAITAALACCPAGGTVYFPKGIYQTSTVFLKSNVQLYLEQGAELKAWPQRERFAVLPGLLDTTAPRETSNLGTWEGDPVDCFAAVVTGIGIKGASIAGQGVVDGAGCDGDWWVDPTKKRGAWRARTLFLNGCEDISVVGITVRNSPSWTIHPYYCSRIQFYDISVQNPGVSPNTDGINPESCHDVKIIGARISVGDDCIAIKSGRQGIAKRYPRSSRGIQVRNCLLERGHGGVVMGSEIACGVHDVRIQQCYLRGTDRGLRVKTQRGRGSLSVVSDIRFENVTMERVQTAFSINMYYYWGPDGHSNYVQSREKAPVDERTPQVKTLYCKNIRCTECEVAGAFFLGLPEMPIGGVHMEDVSLSFDENAKPGEPIMADGVEQISGLGICAENMEDLTLIRVTFQNQKGEPVQTRNVAHYQCQ